jgi:glucose-6-phosphate isomerase
MSQELWQRYQKYLFHDDALELSLDISRMNFSDGFFASLEPRLQKAYTEMEALELGALANPDEGRRVGHYWLRAPHLAPGDLGDDISNTLDDLKTFSAQVHEGEITPQRGGKFENLLVIGIGGSALGPQFVAHALSHPNRDRMKPFFFDNTDPDGMERTLAQIGSGLDKTLTIVISKSGGTKETRNGMLEAQAAYHEAGLHFGNHAVAITGEGSQLDEVATNERWLARFPMWDWIGGRTSETSAVGLLPALLQGFDVDALLSGAAQMDEVTRRRETRQNPSALLAAMWYHATGGQGRKDMVLLPYKDRLELFSRYLQQLLMESLGKEKDLDGRIVHQGIAVYGNKGSTDQHAYVQQLRDGVNNFFVTFIEVLKTRDDDIFEVEPGVTIGDYLFGFLHGTRRALWESGRESLTLTVKQVDAATVGRLIALYERAVGFYASLININAYDQPGVEAGKEAAQAIIELQGHVLESLRSQPGAELTADEIAAHLPSPADAETIFHILRHLEVAGRARRQSGNGPSATFVASHKLQSGHNQ